MAIKRTEVMAPPPVERVTGKKKGWGDIGSKVGAAVGTVAGGVVGMATGGPAGAAVGALGGAAAGASGGQILGEKLRASRSGTTSIDRRLSYQAEGPASGAPSAADKLKESLMAISQAPTEVKQQYAPELLTAYIKTAYPNGNPTA